MIRPARITIVGLSLLWFASLNCALADPAPNVSSTNQTGGVTAGTVIMGPKPDPLRERLASAMTSFNKSAFNSLISAINNSEFTVPVDQDDPMFRTATGEARYYIFWAMDSFGYRVSKIPHCEVGDGGSMIGIEMSLSSTSENAEDVEAAVEFMRPGNSLFDTLCRGLARTPSSIFPDSADFRQSSTMYDYLARGEARAVVIELIPAEHKDMRADASLLRDYWAASILNDYVAMPDPTIGLLLGPEEKARAFSALIEGKGFKLKRPKPPGSLEGVDFAHPYGATMLRDYEGRIEAMDALWLKYLSTATITLGGKKYPVMNGKNFNSQLPVYKSGDFSTDDFWRHLSDTDMFMVQTHCIAAKFAVENGYAKSFDLPAYSQCWNFQTRIIQ